MTVICIKQQTLASFLVNNQVKITYFRCYSRKLNSGIRQIIMNTLDCLSSYVRCDSDIELRSIEAAFNRKALSNYSSVTTHTKCTISRCETIVTQGYILSPRQSKALPVQTVNPLSPPITVHSQDKISPGQAHSIVNTIL